jgi:hypothetical protein
MFGADTEPRRSSDYSNKYVSGDCIFVLFAKFSFILFNLAFGVYSTASVVYWSESLATNPEVPGSIPGATRFPE